MSAANPIVDADFTLLKRHMTKTGVRGARRYLCDLASFCRVIEALSETSNSAWVHDISTAGIGLNYFKELAATTTMTLRLRTAKDGGLITIGATVVHSTPEVNGTWRIGCVFQRELSENELDSCL